MNSIKMFNLKKIILFLYIAFGLTLSVKNESQTDGATENPSSNFKKLSTLTTVIQTKVDSVVSSTTNIPSVNSKDLKANSTSYMQTEGGPVLNSPSEQSPIVDKKVTATNNSTTTVNNVSLNTSVSEIMTTEKDLPTLGRRRGDLLDQTTVNSVTTKHNNNNDNVDNLKVENVTVKQVANVQLSDTNTTVLPVQDLSKQKHRDNVTSTMPPTSKHKPNPKPTVTMGGGAADPNKPIPPSPTRSSPLGMPRKIDYIIPVAITIVALPILGIATFILYNRGKDCWDKRHYRRMDFLIDGMYND